MITMTQEAQRRDFRHRLTTLLESRGLTVRQVAKMVGVPASTIQSWKTGARPSDFFALRKLAIVLNTSLSFLLTGEDDTRDPGFELTIADVLADGGELFDGIAEIRIRRLIPRSRITKK